jgi:hypothetical protein
MVLFPTGPGSFRRPGSRPKLQMFHVNRSQYDAPLTLADVREDA